MKAEREFNLFRFIGRFCIQVMLTKFEWGRKAFALEILPRLAFGHNNQMVFAFGISWLWGDVNFGFMQKGFRKSQLERIQRTHETADKLGITFQQARKMWREY